MKNYPSPNKISQALQKAGGSAPQFRSEANNAISDFGKDKSSG